MEFDFVAKSMPVRYLFWVWWIYFGLGMEFVFWMGCCLVWVKLLCMCVEVFEVVGSSVVKLLQVCVEVFGDGCS